MTPFDETGDLIRGLGALAIFLTVVFILLRAFGAIKWRWYWVISPAVIYIVGLVAFFVLICWAMAKGGM